MKMLETLNVIHSLDRALYDLQTTICCLIRYKIVKTEILKREDGKQYLKIYESGNPANYLFISEDIFELVREYII